MNYSHIFSSFVPKPEKLEGFGFFETESADSERILYCRKKLPAPGFSAELMLNLEKNLLEVHVLDDAADERYALFDVPGAHGSFVGEIREQVDRIIGDFCKTCCASADLHKDYIAFLERHFSVQPEFPWRAESVKLSAKFGVSTETLDDSAVFRCPNGKWFALMMNITYKQMRSGLKALDAGKLFAPTSGTPASVASAPVSASSANFSGTAAAAPFSAEERVWCVNLKAAPDEIPALIDAKSIFPAYHMNKKHWITVALTAATDFDKLCDLTGRSFELVAGKGSRK